MSSTISFLAVAVNESVKLDLYLFPAVAVMIALLIWGSLWYVWKDWSDDGLFSGDPHSQSPSSHPSDSMDAPTAASNFKTTHRPQAVKPTAITDVPVEAPSAAAGKNAGMAPEKSASEAPGLMFKTSTEEEAASLFADDLAKGGVRLLNEIGVYRFKQVAVWTDPACKEFSKMMT